METRLPRSVAELKKAARRAALNLDVAGVTEAMSEAAPHELWLFDKRPRAELDTKGRGVLAVAVPDREGSTERGEPGPLSAAIDVMHRINENAVMDIVMQQIEARLEKLDAGAHWDGLQPAAGELVRRPRYAWRPRPSARCGPSGSAG